MEDWKDKIVRIFHDFEKIMENELEPLGFNFNYKSYGVENKEGVYILFWSKDDI